MDPQMSSQTFKTEIKEETPAECRDEKESPCSDYMYPPGPLELPEYVNYYDSKMYVLKKLKKEFPEDECPQSECSMNQKIDSEYTELSTLTDKEKVIIENIEEKFSSNLKDTDRIRKNQITIKTERLEQQDIRDNSGATSVHYDVPVTPQEFESKFCVKIFKNNSNLLKHNDDHVKIEINTPEDNVMNELHQCQYCDKSFDNYNNMFTHITDVHSENNAKCKICGELFISIPNLKRHMKLLHKLNNLQNLVSPNDMKCIYCNVAFKHKYRLTNHMKICGPGKEDERKKHKCDSCDRIYKRKGALVAHKKKTHYEYGKMFECWCGKQFRSPIHLNEHKSRRHRTNRKNKLYKCNHCETEYNMKTSLTRHMKRTHYNYGRTFDCWCGKQFRTPQYLRGHMKRQHDGKIEDKKDDNVICDYCQKIFKTKQNLIDHIQIVHYDFGKLEEMWRGKQLTRHKQRHSDVNIIDTNNDKLIKSNNREVLCGTGKDDEEIKYKCDLCERVYKKKQSLVSHIKMTHYDYGRMFECWCLKQFRTPMHLAEHKRTRHRKNKLYKCTYCGEVYKVRSSLTLHTKRMHYDYGRTFDCWCGKQFRTPEYLRVHTKRHEIKMENRNDDKAQCDYCQKFFKTKHYVLTHIKTVHYDYGKVFGCWCGKQFRTPIQLRQHKSWQHDGKKKGRNIGKPRSVFCFPTS